MPQATLWQRIGSLWKMLRRRRAIPVPRTGIPLQIELLEDRTALSTAFPLSTVHPPPPPPPPPADHPPAPEIRHVDFLHDRGPEFRETRPALGPSAHDEISALAVELGRPTSLLHHNPNLPPATVRSDAVFTNLTAALTTAANSLA